jgi:hypothetical protein
MLLVWGEEGDRMVWRVKQGDIRREKAQQREKDLLLYLLLSHVGGEYEVDEKGDEVSEKREKSENEEEEN